MSIRNATRIILITCVALGLVYGLFERAAMLAEWNDRYADKIGSPTGFPAFAMNSVPFTYSLFGYFLGAIVSKLYGVIRRRREVDQTGAAKADEV